ncbi:MAG: GTPase HflX [Dissulfuribacterales bacterium]
MRRSLTLKNGLLTITYNKLIPQETVIKLYSNTIGLSPLELKTIKHLYRRRAHTLEPVPCELAREMCRISSQIHRILGITLDRKGNVCHVAIGDARGITIPDLSAYKRSPHHLKGLRFIRTQLGGLNGLTHEDITDMAILRLDAFIVVEALENGNLGFIHVGYPTPPPTVENDAQDQADAHEKTYRTFRYKEAQSAIHAHFMNDILSIEKEIAKNTIYANKNQEAAILVHASPLPRYEMDRSLEELRALSESANVKVLASIRQRIQRYDPAHLLGMGKLKEILIQGMYLGAGLVIFDQNLSPAQINNIAHLVDMKVIDRTQLILDIFARRAGSSEGKIQVELAQLRYALPRLMGRGTAMSRLMGGIGGRGPGETKLEMDRRRIRDRIASLERSLKQLSTRRQEQRKARKRRALPMAALIGYTNAGKSTLFNRLTGSDVLAEDRLFATLDPAIRRLYFPDGRKILLSDTVGFISDMPNDLKVAFKATLEELHEADLFLQILDATSRYKDEEIRVIDEILEEMGMVGTPRILVWNKIDLLGEEGLRILRERMSLKELAISATHDMGLEQLKSAIHKQLFRDSPTDMV